MRHCWVIMLKNQLLHHNYISKYIQIESSCLHFINISALFGEQKGLKNIKNRPQTSELLHETNFSLKRKLWEARDCSFYSEFYLLGNIWNKSNLWFFFPCESVCICGMGSPVCWAGVCLGTDSSPLWFFWSVCVCVRERELAFSPGLSVCARVWRHNTVHKKPLVLKTPEEHWRRIKMNQWLTHTFKTGLTLYTKS